MMNPNFRTTAETAKLLHMAPSTVRKLIHNGELRAVRAGKHAFRIPILSIKEYLAP